MILELSDTEIPLGRSSIILRDRDVVKKYYIYGSVKDGAGWDRQSISEVKLTTEMLKMFHPDLFVDFEITKDYYCVITRYIDHTNSLLKPYEVNLKNYLRLVEVFGYDKSKTDLNCYNLVYDNIDTPYILDWDNYVDFDCEESAYDWYKNELTGFTWLEHYNITKENAESIFDQLWKNA